MPEPSAWLVRTGDAVACYDNGHVAIRAAIEATEDGSTVEPLYTLQAARERIAGELEAEARKQRESWTGVVQKTGIALAYPFERVARFLRRRERGVVSDRVGEPVELWLCEARVLYLKPDTLYRFKLHPTCEACAQDAECAGPKDGFHTERWPDTTSPGAPHAGVDWASGSDTASWTCPRCGLANNVTPVSAGLMCASCGTVPGDFHLRAPHTGREGES